MEKELSFYWYLQQYNIKLAELSKKSGMSKSTLQNWYKNPERKLVLDMVIDGFKYQRGDYEV